MILTFPQHTFSSVMMNSISLSICLLLYFTVCVGLITNFAISSFMLSKFGPKSSSHGAMIYDMVLLVIWVAMFFTYTDLLHCAYQYCKSKTCLLNNPNLFHQASATSFNLRQNELYHMGTDEKEFFVEQGKMNMPSDVLPSGTPQLNDYATAAFLTTTGPFVSPPQTKNKQRSKSLDYLRSRAYQFGFISAVHSQHIENDAITNDKMKLQNIDSPVIISQFVDYLEFDESKLGTSWKRDNGQVFSGNKKNEARKPYINEQAGHKSSVFDLEKDKLRRKDLRNYSLNLITTGYKDPETGLTLETSTTKSITGTGQNTEQAGSTTQRKISEVTLEAVPDSEPEQVQKFEQNEQNVQNSARTDNYSNPPTIDHEKVKRITESTSSNQN